jgi:GR25 family glycosyltransferase involved in LPS biosynthesis
MLRGYVITSELETQRAPFVKELMEQLPGIQQAKAIYPTQEHVPFLNRLKENARTRFFRPFMDGEIGILLSNRRIWKEIVRTNGPEQEHFLILESDSVVNDPAVLKQLFHATTQEYDLFFWGAWHGYMRLLKSSKRSISEKYVIGTPLMRSVSCAHGYSINRKAARHLLERTGKLRYQVDEFKRYIDATYLKVGGISPELISQRVTDSLIDPGNKAGRTNWTWIRLLDIRNRLICYFS